MCMKELIVHMRCCFIDLATFEQNEKIILLTLSPSLLPSRVPITLPAPSCLLVWWSNTLSNTMGCTTTSVTTEVSPGALLLRAIAAAAEEGPDLLDRRSAGEHPYVVGWARAAAMVVSYTGFWWRGEWGGGVGQTEPTPTILSPRTKMGSQLQKKSLPMHWQRRKNASEKIQCSKGLLFTVQLTTPLRDAISIACRIYITSSSSNTASQQPAVSGMVTVESEYRHMLDCLLKIEEQSSQWYQVSPSLVQDMKNVLDPSQRWRHKICDW